MARVIIPFVTAMLICLATGCNSLQPYRTHKRLARGLVIVLPGIEGRGGLNEAICHGLNDGGVNWAIELYDWTSPLGLLYNLRAEDRNRRRASQLAWRITRYLWDYPGRPVILVGQSGGGAIAVWTAEKLLTGLKIDGIILLAASLSPEYLLDFALANTRRGIVSFCSSRDWMLLGVGTTVYGTMDGRHTSSAGRVGFKIPEDPPSKAAYEKVYQIAWQREMSEVGNPGFHLTSGAARFVADYVAPFILADPNKIEWGGELVGEVLDRKWLEQPPVSPLGEWRQASSRLTEPAPRPSTRPVSRPTRRPSTRRSGSRPRQASSGPTSRPATKLRREKAPV